MKNNNGRILQTPLFVYFLFEFGSSTSSHSRLSVDAIASSLNTSMLQTCRDTATSLYIILGWKTGEIDK